MLRGFHMGRCGTGTVPLSQQAELTKEMEQRSTGGITALLLLEAHVSPSCRFAHGGHRAAAVGFLKLNRSCVRMFAGLQLHITIPAAGRAQRWAPFPSNRFKQHKAKTSSSNLKCCLKTPTTPQILQVPLRTAETQRAPSASFSSLKQVGHLHQQPSPSLAQPKPSRREGEDLGGNAFWAACSGVDHLYAWLFWIPFLHVAHLQLALLSQLLFPRSSRLSHHSSSAKQRARITTPS